MEKMSVGQARELHSRLVRCAPDDLDTDLAQALNDASPEIIREFLAGLKTLQVFCSVPEDGEEFELSLDGNAVDPLAMVRKDGYSGEWQFNGPKVEGVQTRRFQLVRLGYCPNLDEAKAKAQTRGYRLAEGEWREAFRKRFLRPAVGDLIAFGGSGWSDPYGGRGFPYLDESDGAWDSDFDWVGSGFDEDWRWLVSK